MYIYICVNIYIYNDVDIYIYIRRVVLQQRAAARSSLQLHRRLLQGQLLTRSVFKVVVQKLIPTQIRQLISLSKIVDDRLTDLWGG